MFIGGLNWDTSDESLRDYFSQFGPVVECIVMRDPLTQRSRGFGFLTMKENADVDKIVSQEHHYLDGKRIDPKRAIPREEQDKTEKIFVGGISPEVNEEEFRTFFSQFGTVLDATLMLERDTGRPRGFGFITFEDSQGVEEALKNPHLSIKDKTVS
ncbi:Interdomain Rrm packing contributes To Rna recognition in the Rna15, Hrp1, anchor Rna 3 [Gilbertella persicaria]|uniref:Interdomain Rrm packing contributes To Rna recognition in the Rna15, Hrp1, anchor Rna 3 n=1 Tax=Gilbertella persicaria TaxID=101096 RepID=UPI00221EFB7E|nr:Interdomain Rrm packing contributes To Rna recognition in the Rna15, Hrp1, anchor Rna 3 [Gilbertella persicaria]KAI8070587.1 Interdomain Rrm packing contributes To Rna recognition in the Rna15, Hrp1, anchor Rna 3 [Gilbertella persicaria]